MKTKFLATLALCAYTCAPLVAQELPDASKFQTSPGGLKYFFVQNKDTRNAKVGDHMQMHILFKVEDSVIFDSKVVNNNQPVPNPVGAPQFEGDISEIFTMIGEGDIIWAKADVDVLAGKGMQLPPFLKQGVGQTMDYYIEVVKVQTPEEYEADLAKKAEAQKKTDDAIIAKYLKDNKIKAQKTESGLYYVISKKGNGTKPKNGEQVSMNYTGKLLNGESFDSNVDPQFNHVQPFVFPLGQGRVIKGWDEGVALLDKGAKATFFIPSTLAYGERGAGGKIGPNEVLIFDVELVDILPAVEANPAPQAIPVEPGHEGHNH